MIGWISIQLPRLFADEEKQESVSGGDLAHYFAVFPHLNRLSSYSMTELSGQSKVG